MAASLLSSSLLALVPLAEFNNLLSLLSSLLSEMHQAALKLQVGSRSRRLPLLLPDAVEVELETAAVDEDKCHEGRVGYKGVFEPGMAF